MAVVVALDWTPNTNHVGFYVAKGTHGYCQSTMSLSL